VNDLALTIVAELRASRKYRHLCAETLERVAHWALDRHPAKEASAAARRKLHQVFASYCECADLDRLAGRVAALPDPADAEELRTGCRELLANHASTAERLGLLDGLYETLWREIGRPGVVLDLACGYHPFALPWMGLKDSAVYHGCDIDTRLVAAANAFLARLGRSPNVVCKDVLIGMPDCRADVALLLKTLPCLEQQQKDVGPEFLRAIPARHVVVSFPAASLGGRRKGMRVTYDSRMSEIAAQLNVPVRPLEFATETFYLLTMEHGNKA
jgi:16S rRNA (guanine(1405)-N(7))-methyltransferase